MSIFDSGLLGRAGPEASLAAPMYDVVEQARWNAAMMQQASMAPAGMQQASMAPAWQYWATTQIEGAKK